MAPAHGANDIYVSETEICPVADGALLNILDTLDPSGQCQTKAHTVLTLSLLLLVNALDLLIPNKHV